jgi:hypothetical protein
MAGFDAHLRPESPLTMAGIRTRTEDEPGFLVVGTISDRFWSAVVTYRGENVWIISVRRSRPEDGSHL